MQRVNINTTGEIWSVAGDSNKNLSKVTAPNDIDNKLEIMAKPNVQQTITDYMDTKQRLNQSNKVANNDKIASLGIDTNNRGRLVERLLGQSKEARYIRSKFLKMVEVSQNNFSLRNFKNLNDELRLKVCKPDRLYT